MEGFPLAFPDVDKLREQAVKITDRETRALNRWAMDNIPGYQGAGLNKWALHTLAEHFRALLVGVDPDESTWPDEHKQVLAELERIADRDG